MEATAIGEVMETILYTERYEFPNSSFADVVYVDTIDRAVYFHQTDGRTLHYSIGEQDNPDIYHLADLLEDYSASGASLGAFYNAYFKNGNFVSVKYQGHTYYPKFEQRKSAPQASDTLTTTAGSTTWKSSTSSPWISVSTPAQPVGNLTSNIPLQHVEVTVREERQDDTFVLSVSFTAPRENGSLSGLAQAQAMVDTLRNAGFDITFDSLDNNF